MKSPPLLIDPVKKSGGVPGRLDLFQSVSGLLLALFMWTHLVLVASILLGKDAMMWVTRLMEASFLKPGAGGGYPQIPALIAAVVFLLLLVHAVLAVRKFPANFAQYRSFRSHMKMMRHSDTNQWFLQALTGFILMFIASVHVYVMFTQADNIGPYASSDRFVTGLMWPLYLVLLFCVELHATLGMYRLAVKWGVFDGKNPRETRRRLKWVKNAATAFFLVVGVLTFAAYMKIGIDHRPRAGERYATSTAESGPVVASQEARR